MIGVVPDLTWGISNADQDRTIVALRESGAKWVRLSIDWRLNEPAVPGVHDIWWTAHVDRAVEISNAAGLNMLMVVYDAPVWASGSTARNTPRNPADYARFMGYIANRYRGKIKAYEVWNEPNIERFWTNPNAAEYTRMLQATYPAVKTADPAATVVFGGPSHADYRYIEAAYAAGAKGYFDAMAVHPYTYCGTGAPDTINSGGDGRIDKGSFLSYREVRKTMLAQGDDKPIWMTEFGWNTSTVACDPARGIWQGGVSEAAQASYLARAYELFAADPYVGPAFVYNFRNNYWSGDANDPEARYGLLRTDFSRKPAFEALRAAAGATPPAPVEPAPAAPLTVTLTAPTEGLEIRGTITFAATASADGGIARVVFAVDGRAIKEVTVAPYGSRWTGFRRLRVGPHVVEARAYDRAGQVATDSANVTKLP